VRVDVSDVIDAPVEKVRGLIRDFNGVSKWHPFVRDSPIENGMPSGAIGCARNFHLTNGDHLRDQLLTVSERDRECVYCISAIAAICRSTLRCRGLSWNGCHPPWNDDCGYQLCNPWSLLGAPGSSSCSISCSWLCQVLHGGLSYNEPQHLLQDTRGYEKVSQGCYPSARSAQRWWERGCSLAVMSLQQGPLQA
jgi:hypothetical protein